MTEGIDFFFSAYPSAQSRRLQAAIEDGLAHGSRIAPHDPLPGSPVTLFFSSNALKPIERVAVYYTVDGTEPAGERGRSKRASVVLAEPVGSVVHDREKGLAIQQWQAVLPPQPEGTLVQYRAEGWSPDDPRLHWYADQVDPLSKPQAEGHCFAYHVDRWDVPQWWPHAVVYHIFIDRFSAGKDEPPLQDHDARAITDFFGGTLHGIIDKLDYVQALGVNCLYLSPVMESPTHHGYNASDFFSVARRYGTNETLRQLIADAHARGIRVLLDFAPNHTSDEHAAFLAARRDPTAPTAQWYDFSAQYPRGYRSYAQVPDMPELNTDNAAVRRHLYDAALYWLEHFGADGLRLDYVPGPSHAFWTFLQREVKERFPLALTLGEIPSSLAEIADYAGRIDAFMDFPLAHLLRSTFARRTTPLAALLRSLAERRGEIPATMSTATLLDNHDMHRFLWLAQGDVARLKLAAACQMTLEGTPIIYYGTEVGLSQYADSYQENAYSRAPMLWGERQNLSLLAHYRNLIALRNVYPALRVGARTTVDTEVEGQDAAQAEQVGAYLRYMNSEYLLVVLNNNTDQVRVRIALVEALTCAGIVSCALPELHCVFATHEQRDLAVNEGSMMLELPPLGAAIFAGKASVTEQKGLLRDS